MTKVKQQSREVLTGSKKNELLKELKLCNHVINDKLILQNRADQSQFLIYNSDQTDGIQEASRSDLVQQLENKIVVLQTIDQNIKNNISMLEQIPTDDEENKECILCVELEARLEDIFSDSKLATKEWENYKRSGLEELMKLKAKRKPKQKTWWQKFGLVLIGVGCIAAGTIM